MKLHSETREREAKFEIDPTTSKIAVTDFKWNSFVPFADSDRKAITGAETLILPSCATRQEFIDQINESKFVHVSVRDDFFTVTDCRNLFSTHPGGIYKSAVVDKRVSVTKESNDEFTLSQYPDVESFTSSAKNIYVRGGEQNIETGFLSFGGTSTHTKLLQSNALSLSSDLVQDNNKVPLKVSYDDVTFVRAKQKEQFVELKKNGRIVYDTLLQDDSIRFSLIGANNGLFIESPCFSWINKHSTGENKDGLDISEAGFVLRAGSIFRQKQIQIVAPFPLDIKELLIKRVANDIYEISAIKKDETIVLCLRTVAVGLNTRFCISNFEQTVERFLLPVLRQTTSNASRDGFLVTSIRTPASNSFDVLSSPKIDLSVANSKLVCNGTTTDLDIAQSTNYLIVVEKETDLEIQVWNLDTQVAQTFTDEAVAYTHSVAMDGVITWKQNLILGAWCYGTTLADVDKAVQIIRSEAEGKPSYANLGPFNKSAGTFANYGATYTKQLLTVSGIQYNRQKLLFSPQVANILRTQREFVGTYSSVRKSYINRVDKAHLYCDGLDISGYNDSNLIALVDIGHKIRNPVWHKCSGKQAELYYIVIDNQTLRQRDFVKPHSEKWSVSIETE